MVGLSGEVQVCIRIVPSDASNPSGTADVSGLFTVDNLAYNENPSVTVNTPAGVQSGNVQITYTLTDTESDTCLIVVEYSVDGGAWQAASMGPAGDGTTGLPSSPGGTQHMFLWDSRADNVGPLAQQSNVRIRITPGDFHTGTAVATNPFSVNNSVPNNPPTVSITSGPANGSTIYTDSVTFVWSGSDTDGSISGYYYSFDKNPPDIWTAGTSVTSGILTEGSHTFRVVAMDDDGDFSTVVSRTFTVLLTGTINADFAASTSTGTVPLAVQFTDLSSSGSGITSWSWDFGDGNTSSLQNPSHTYYFAGSYAITLTVSGPDGSDTKAKANHVTVSSSGTPSGTDWNTFGKNNQRTSYIPEEELVFPLSLLWEKEHTGGVRRPCGEQGVIFYAESGSTNYKFYGVRLSDGSVKWSNDLGDLSYCGYAAVFDGKVFVQCIDDSSNNERVYCFRAHDGFELWNSPWSSQWSIHEAPVSDGTNVYFYGGYGGGIYSFNISNGAQNWFTVLPQKDPISICLYNGIAYTHYPYDSSDAIYATRLSDGEILWKMPDGGSSHSSTPVPCVAWEGVLVTADPLAAWDISTRTQKWVKPYRCIDAPAVDEGYVYAAGQSTNTLAKINIHSGAQEWLLPINYSTSGQPVVTKYHVIVPTNSITYFVNRYLGTVEWTCDYGGEVIVVNGRVVITSKDRKYIRCLGVGDGQPPETTANPPGGTYVSPVSVTLQSNESATIYYTTDSTTPTRTSYTGMGQSPITGIQITGTTTLQFFAVDAANNEELLKTEEFTITNGSLAVASGTLPVGAVGSSYGTTLLAVGGTPPYSWEVTSNTLPSGLTLTTPTGAISGIPTIGQTRTFTVTVTDTVSTTSLKQLSIEIKPVAADFSATPDAGNAPLVVHFTDESLGMATSWEWDFGDGSTSTGRNPTHTYALPGTYTVAFTPTVRIGSDTVTRTDYVVVQGGPTVLITHAPPHTTFDTTPSFAYEASVFGGTIVGFSVGIDESPPTTWTVRRSWTSPPLGDGQHTFYVQAQSGDGTKSAIVSYTFTVDGGGAPPPATDWNTFGKNNQHTAHNPGEELTFPLTLVWEKEHGGYIQRPCGENGVIFYPEYVPDASLSYIKLQAVRLADGGEKWSCNLRSSTGIPAVFDGKVFLRYARKAACFSGDDGALLWESLWSAQSDDYEAPCVDGGNLYICGGYFGGMYSYRVSDGMQNWFAGLPQETGMTPCLWGAKAYTFYSRFGVYSTLLSDGSITVEAETSTGSSSMTCIASNGILLTSYPLTAWDISTMTKVWEKGYTCRPPAVADGYVYAVNSNTYSLVKIDLATGAQQWLVPIGTYLSGQIVVTKHHVIVPTANFTCFVNHHLGREEWRCDYGGEVIAVNGYVVMENNGNHIWCLSGDPNIARPETAASPPGGTYAAPVDVTLTADRAATIYYTTDGTNPNTNNYTGNGASPVANIHLDTGTTLKFFAIDAAGKTELVKTQEYTITGGSLAITTDSLPAGAVQDGYAQTLVAVGGTPPYDWQVIYGELPSGLTLESATGEISGTPTRRETERFIVALTDSANATRCKELTIVIEEVVAGFSPDPATGAAPLVVQFTDTSLGTVTGWKWDLGDGITSTEQNPIHTYSLPGVYTVTLTASTASRSDTISRKDCITVQGGPLIEITNSPPAATFDTTPTFVYQAGVFGDTIVGFRVGTDASPPTVWTTGRAWTSPALADGLHTFYVQAESGDGSRSNIASFTFTVDVSTAPPPSTDWHTLGKNNQHTAHSPDEDFTFPLSLVWEKEHAGTLTRPCGEQGVIFYSQRGADEGILAVRLSDGNVNWSRELNLKECPPAVFDGKVFLQHSGKISCFYAESGMLLWETKWSSQHDWYEAPCVDGGNLYVCGGTYGGMYSFKVSDGTRNWFADLPQFDETTPCLYNSVAYTHYPDDGAGDYNIWATRLSDGEVLWNIKDNSTWHGWSAIACVASNGTLITPDPLAAWDISTRAQKWEKAYRCLTPAIADGYVYAVSKTDNTLTKIDINTGAQAWSFPLADYATGQPVVTKNHVIVPTPGLTYFVNLQTGAQEWTCDYGGQVVTVNGYVLITDSAAKRVWCLK